jgi:hypothetical protein
MFSWERGGDGFMSILAMQLLSAFLVQSGFTIDYQGAVYEWFEYCLE